MCVNKHIHQQQMCNFFLGFSSKFLIHYSKQTNLELSQKVHLNKIKFNSILKHGWVLCANAMVIT